MKRSSPNPSGKKLYSTAEDVLKFYGSLMIRKKRGAPSDLLYPVLGVVHSLEKLNTMWRIAWILLKELTGLEVPIWTNSWSI